jgi:hypothetical protein
LKNERRNIRRKRNTRRIRNTRRKRNINVIEMMTRPPYMFSLYMH